jgi:hypothetical protein
LETAKERLLQEIEELQADQPRPQSIREIRTHVRRELADIKHVLQAGSSPKVKQLLARMIPQMKYDPLRAG